MPEGIQQALLVFNPTSGRSRSSRLKRIDRARSILARHGITTEIAPTAGPGDATEIAKKAVIDRVQMVIACGGDGTCNEVVNGLAGSDVPLALLPAGTANVLAKELSLPWSIEGAAELVAGSQLRRVALGHMTMADDSAGRYFISLAGAGPDGAIVYAVSAGLKKTAGVLAYWVQGISQLVRYDFPQFRVSTGGQVMDATLIIIGRTKHYGGPFKITTEADLHSDEFEVMICTTRSPWRYLGYLSVLWAGRLRDARYVHFLKATTVQCEPLTHPQKTYVQVDGESAGHLPAQFRIVPDALTLAVPSSTPALHGRDR